MVGYLTKADCPTMGHLTTCMVMSNPYYSPIYARGGSGEYIDRCYYIVQHYYKVVAMSEGCYNLVTALFLVNSLMTRLLMSS